MNLHMKMAVTVAVAGRSSAAPAGPRLCRTPTPLVAPALTGVAALPGPLAPAATPAASMGVLDDEARRRRGRHEVHGHAARASRRTRPSRSPGAPRTSPGSSTRAPTASTTSAARPTSSTVVLGTATTDANGTFTRRSRRRRTSAASTTSTPSSTASRSRRAASSIARSASITPEAGPDRDDAHGHVQRPRLLALRGRRLAAVRQQVHGRDHGELDARRRRHAHPRERARSAGTRSRSRTRSASST